MPEEGHKRAPDSLELRFQIMVSCPVWGLGTKLTSPGRAAHTQLLAPSLPTFVFLIDMLSLGSRAKLVEALRLRLD